MNSYLVIRNYFPLFFLSSHQSPTMLVVGIAGGTGSGKTTVVRKIMQSLKEENVGVMHQDSYYRDSSHLPMEERQQLNFDHPASIEFELMVEHIRQLRNGTNVQVPVYSYLTCTRSNDSVPLTPKEVLIVEGILILTHPDLRDMFDMKVYVDAEADDRLIRVIRRDIVERGRDVNTVLERYEKTVKQMHDQFIEPTKKFADIIVPQGGENKVGIGVLTSTIRMNLTRYSIGNE